MLFLTGLTGTFGRWFLDLLDYLVANGSDVRAFVLTRDPIAASARLGIAAARPWLRFIRGDICDFQFDGPADWIVHGAVPSSRVPDPSDPQIKRLIVEGTHRLLSCARKCRASRILFLSSGAIYGDLRASPPPFAESEANLEASSADSDPYTAGKAASEKLLLEAHGEFNVLVARCFSFVGPGMPLDSHFAIGNLISQALNGVPIELTGDGSPVRSYLYGPELAFWLACALAKVNEDAIFNVGGETAYALRDLAKLVRDLLAPRLSVSWNPDRPSSKRNYYVPDTAAAKAVFGFCPIVSLQEAIQSTALAASRAGNSR